LFEGRKGKKRKNKRKLEKQKNFLKTEIKRERKKALQLFIYLFKVDLLSKKRSFAN
jgi:hypothetical protein